MQIGKEEMGQNRGSQIGPEESLVEENPAEDPKAQSKVERLSQEFGIFKHLHLAIDYVKSLPKPYWALVFIAFALLPDYLVLVGLAWLARRKLRKPDA